MDECLHKDIIDNTCIQCGYTISESLVSYVTHINPIKNGKLNYKYSLADTDFFITQCILEILPNTPHLDEIKHLVLTKKFKKRTSTIDKVITSAYYILKKNNSDVVKVDLVKYCKNGYYHFLKLVSEEFGYMRNTEKYIENVTKRVHRYLQQRDYDFDCNEIYQKVIGYEDVGCANVIDLVLCFVFEDDIADSFEMYDLHNLTYKSCVERVWKRMKPKDVKKVNNVGLVKRIDKVLEHIRDADLKVVLDEIDLYIERKILNGADINKMKKMTMKQLKSEIDNENQ